MHRCTAEPIDNDAAYAAERDLLAGPDGRVFKKDGALKEYDARVQGINATEAGIHQFTGFIMAAIAGITAAGIGAHDQYLFLIPFGLLILGNLYITEKRWVIWLHAAYIRKYLENEQTGIWWESRLRQLRKGTRSPVGGIKRVEYWMFFIIGLLEAALFARFDTSAIQDFQRIIISTSNHSFLLYDYGLFVLKHILPYAPFLLLVLLAKRNFNALKTGKAEEDLFAALPGDKCLPSQECKS